MKACKGEWVGMSRLKVISLLFIIVLSVFGTLVSWSCLGYRNAVKVDYLVFTLDPAYSWEAQIISNTDFIAIFDS